MKYSFFEILGLLKNLLLTKLFYKKARLIRFPFYIRGKKYIKWSKGFTTGYSCRLDAFPIDKSDICIEIGENCQINDNVHIGAVKSIKIGNNVLIASKVFISDHNHGYYGQDERHDSPLTTPKGRELSYKEVIIGDNVWIGEFVSVLHGVTIGNGCVIGSNSVVNKSIPPYSIAVGNPAKVIKVYNFEEKKWIKV